MAAIRVVEVAADDPVLRPLIASHMAHAEKWSPETSRHNLDVDEVASEAGLRMWVAFDGDAALGCAALKPFGDMLAEVKSVHVLPAARGRGVARLLMETVTTQARAAKIKTLYLETGSEALPAFDAARRLYEGLGFGYCPPFASYQLDPYSAFMRSDL